MFLRSSGMVKSEPVDDVPVETVASPPAKRPRGRPRKDGKVSGQGKTAVANAAGSSAGRGKGGGRSNSKKAKREQGSAGDEEEGKLPSFIAGAGDNMGNPTVTHDPTTYTWQQNSDDGTLQ